MILVVPQAGQINLRNDYSNTWKIHGEMGALRGGLESRFECYFKPERVWRTRRQSGTGVRIVIFH